MSVIASQIAGVLIVYSTVCSGADERKYQGSASLAFVGGIQLWSVDSPHKGPVTQKMFPFDDVIMCGSSLSTWSHVDFMTWRYVSHYSPFVVGVQQLPLDSPHKGPVIWSFSLLQTRQSCWITCDVKVGTLSWFVTYLLCTFEIWFIEE